MALSKTIQDLSIGSDTEKGDLCAACAVDGEYRPAVKFCLDCNQPICQSCVDSHRRIKHIQGHKLVDNKNEDAVKTAKILSSCLVCPNHPDKNIEFICADHDVFCCSTCATVNHRGCRQVKEVAAVAQMSSDITTTMKHVADAKTHIEGIVKLHQNSNQEFQLQARQSIPKQIQEMKASILKTFDELELILLKETRRLGVLKVIEVSSEIARWQSHLTTITDGANLLSVAQQNGSDVHKYIAAKNTEKKLGDVDSSICQASQLNLESMSFAFDKKMFLQNASVAINNVNKTLAEMDGEVTGNQGKYRKQQASHLIYKSQGALATNRATNSFANHSVETTTVLTPDYPYRQPSFSRKQRGFYN